MGFLDKAKQVAEQAQKKLEEVQSDFNERQSERARKGAPEEGPAGEGPPAEQAPPPSGEPAEQAPDPFKPIEEG